MFRVHVLLLILFFRILSIQSYNITSCIPNTSCKCLITPYAFNFMNCSHTVPDIPIFDSQSTSNVTRIIARNAFNQWPIQLCKYPNIQILDLSGSYFDSKSIDFTCLNHLIHLNLSNTQLKKIPNFQENLSNHLQILDLSNNHIKILNGIHFQSLTNLISLFLHNNSIESIQHFEYLLSLPNLESINLISSNYDITLKQSLTTKQWIELAKQWANSNKLLIIRVVNIPFQSVIPSPDQFESVSTRLMKVILKKLINSTFMTLSNTPKCDCSDLRSYQRMFSYVDYQKKYSSPLFNSVKCLMSDGYTYARLFDRRTTIDLRCPSLGKKLTLLPLLSSSSSMFNSTFTVLLFICIFLSS